MKSYWQSTVLFLGSLLLGAALAWLWIGHTALACEVEKMEALYNQRLIESKNQTIDSLEGTVVLLKSQLAQSVPRKIYSDPIRGAVIERVYPEPILSTGPFEVPFSQPYPMDVSPTEHASLMQLGKAAASETLQQAKALIQSGWRLMAGAPRLP